MALIPFREALIPVGPSSALQISLHCPARARRGGGLSGGRWGFRRLGEEVGDSEIG